MQLSLLKELNKTYYMKSIYNIYESILDDIETTMANGANDVIIDMLFSKYI